MNLSNLFHSVDEDQVIDHLITYYEDGQEHEYRQAWKTIQTLDRKKSTIEKIQIRQMDEFFHVVGLDGNERWALDMTPWSEWLDLEIDNPDSLTPAAFAAHALYEMTILGFSEQQIQNQRIDLLNQIQDIKSQF